MNLNSIYWLVMTGLTTLTSLLYLAVLKVGFLSINPKSMTAIFCWVIGLSIGSGLNELWNFNARKRHNTTKKHYPSKAVALLDIFLKDDEHDDFFDHFEESFEKRRKRSGLRVARLWVWKQVFLTVGPLLWRIIRGAVTVWKLDEIWKKFIQSEIMKSAAPENFQARRFCWLR